MMPPRAGVRRRISRPRRRFGEHRAISRAAMTREMPTICYFARVAPPRGHEFTGRHALAGKDDAQFITAQGLAGNTAAGISLMK